jgi:monoamine oxidase
MAETLRADVVVIGAGVSGLVAATRVAATGRTVIVLEARDRVGGRTYTVPFAGGRVDLGGQWLGPTQDRAYALCRELGISTFAQHRAGRRVLDLGVDRRLQHYRGTIPPLALGPALDAAQSLGRIQLMTYLISVERPWASRFATRWDALSLAEWLRRNTRTRDARALAEIGAEMLLCADPEDISLLYFLFYLRSGGGFARMAEVENGAQQDRLAGGAQGLALGLAAKLQGELRLAAPVRRIAQTATQVCVEADGVIVRADRAILALAPALADRIQFDPEPPAGRRLLHARMPMGSAVKVVIGYERAFWRERGLRGDALSSGFPCRAYFDDCAEGGTHPALVGFVVGPDARRFGALAAPERKAAVLAQLGRVFGDGARRANDYLDHDWVADAWSGGCYVGVCPPGVLTRVGGARATAHARVHFAGTETARRWTGYIDGAIEAGERAAAEVCAAG